jgi:acetyl esterase/lipase
VNETVGRAFAVQLPGMGRAPAYANLAYHRVAGQDLAMDVYLPADARSPSPAVLLGGPPAFWAGKNSSQKVGWAQILAASGLAAVTFDHRSDQFMKTPLDPIEDVGAALDYVHDRGLSIGIDPERLALLGFSLGTGPWHVAAAFTKTRPYVRALVLYYALLDFDDSEVRPRLEDVDVASGRSHLARSRGAFPRTLLVKAGRERFAGINSSIDRFVATAREVGVQVELITHEDGEHGFDTRGEHPRTTEIVMRTIEMLRSALRRDAP